MRDQATPMFLDEPPHYTPEEERRLALSYLTEAFDDARHEGIEPSCMAMVALFKSFAEMIQQHGEEAVAEFASALPDRVRSGEFTIARVRH